ncbi:MAG: hypothetical protein FWG72_08265 [Oscillospiraceae bacterium]|nr:hypothetical protein [Oscillospiraceae bacterium]
MYNIKSLFSITGFSLEALARCLLPAIRSYFESEEGQCEFAEWQSRRSIVSLPRKEVGSDIEFRRAV